MDMEIQLMPNQNDFCPQFGGCMTGYFKIDYCERFGLMGEISTTGCIGNAENDEHDLAGYKTKNTQKETRITRDGVFFWAATKLYSLKTTTR